MFDRSRRAGGTRAHSLETLGRVYPSVSRDSWRVRTTTRPVMRVRFWAIAADSRPLATTTLLCHARDHLPPTVVGLVPRTPRWHRRGLRDTSPGVVEGMRKMRQLAVRAALAGLVVLAVGARQARGANLVVNGDFETGDLTGWTLTGSTGFTGINTSGNSPHGGGFQMSFGAVGSDSVLMQSAQIRTIPGALCQFSFWLRNEDTGNSNDFSASWDNGTPLVSLVDANAFDYTQYTFIVKGRGSDNIAFRAGNPSAYYDLDDVSVECAQPAAAPTLSPIPLVGLGGMLAGVGIWLTRRRTRVTP